MTFERSHGKVRPTLPRSSDLRPAEAVRNPREGRSSGGHFAAGNRHGVGARWKATIKKTLGRLATDGDALIVQRDAFRLYLATLRALPCDAAPVRSMVAAHARCMAVSAYLNERAAAVGLDTDDGARLLGLALQQTARAERTLVTANDLARSLAEAERRRPSAALPPWLLPDDEGERGT